MKVLQDRTIETHHFTRHLKIAKGPIVQMRHGIKHKFRVTHIVISWHAGQGKDFDVMARGFVVDKRGKKLKIASPVYRGGDRIKSIKKVPISGRRAYNNPKKRPKWLINALIEGAQLNGKAVIAQRERPNHAGDRVLIAPAVSPDRVRRDLGHVHPVGYTNGL